MKKALQDLDLTNFWDNCDYAREEYIGKSLSQDMVKEAEARLGYKLPTSYVELMTQQNGGTPNKTNHRTKEPTSWAEDHVAITGIFGLDKEKTCSLCNEERGSRFWIEEWGYPDIGVYICDCPSAGHDMICLDYRKNGPTGEPEVVHIDQERDYEVTFVAKTFEEFVRNLEDDEAFE